MEAGMDITVGRHTDCETIILTLRGDLDLHSAEELRNALRRLIDGPVSRVVIDLGAVAFCDSVGLSAFVDGHRRCKAAGGYLRLAAASPFLQRILAVVGLLGPVPLYRTVEAACAGDESQLAVEA
jgi:anti-sigma B factor antagonist